MKKVPNREDEQSGSGSPRNAKSNAPSVVMIVAVLAALMAAIYFS